VVTSFVPGVITGRQAGSQTLGAPTRPGRPGDPWSSGCELSCFRAGARDRPDL